MVCGLSSLMSRINVGTSSEIWNYKSAIIMHVCGVSVMPRWFIFLRWASSSTKSKSQYKCVGGQNHAYNTYVIVLILGILFLYVILYNLYCTMASWHGNVFRVTGSMGGDPPALVNSLRKSPIAWSLISFYVNLNNLLNHQPSCQRFGA